MHARPSCEPRQPKVIVATRRRAQSVPCLHHSGPLADGQALCSALVAQPMSAFVYHRWMQQHQQKLQAQQQRLAAEAGLTPQLTPSPSPRPCNYRLPKVAAGSADNSSVHLAASTSLRRSTTNISEVYAGRASSSSSAGRASSSHLSRARRSAGDISSESSSLTTPSRQGLGPHERVFLSESNAHPEVPLAHRNAEERAANPDRLSLDRRGLVVCPILEGEDNLRLLNYQHNLITRIQHLCSLRKLIFLDLYDNRIEAISGLSSLKSLRVLMLGKNRISKIEGLDALVKLDVLDLHGNEIYDLTNLTHLSELRVLNLAGNRLVHVRNLTGLNALSELNLRRNRIRQVEDVDMLPSIQRLFLSFNDIQSWQNIACLGDATSLVELTLDGNPMSRETNYKQTLIHFMPQLKQLDMKRISDEERRMAVTIARKEEEKRRETSKTAALKEKRRLAITNARRQWESMQASLLARGTLPTGLSIPSTSGGGRMAGRGPPELFATHVSTVLLPRPQSAASSSAATTSRDEAPPSTPHGDEVTSRPPSGRMNRPGSARTTIAMATVTALPSSGLTASPPMAPSSSPRELHSELATPSSSTLDANEFQKAPPAGASKLAAGAHGDSGFLGSAKTSVCENDDSTGSESRILSETPETQWSPGKTSSCHLAEVQGGDQLHLYGPGSIEALDRHWGLQAAGNIHTVKFAFIDFDDLWRHLHKIRARFPAVQTLIFASTNIRCLTQLSALAVLRRIDSLTIEAEGNPVVSFTLWRPFLLFRLAALGLRKINGVEVRPSELLNADRLFAPITNMTTTQLSQAHLLSLLNEAKRKQQQQQQQQQQQNFLAVLTPEVAVGKLGLVYNPDLMDSKLQAATAKRSLAGNVLRNIVDDAVNAELNRDALARCWPQLFRGLVSRAVEDCLMEPAQRRIE